MVPPVDEDVFLLNVKRELNEFQVSSLRLNLDDYKLFEIKCNEVPLSDLPAGAKAPRFDTEFEQVNLHSPGISAQMNGYKKMIAGVMQPGNPEELARIEAQMALNRTDMKLKQEYEECLKRCVCLELIQIKEFIMSQNEGMSGATG